MEYHEALMRRLGMIRDLGDNATRIAMEQQQSRPSQWLNNMPSPNAPSGGNGQQQAGGSFGSFLNAIVGQESGGNYGARNPHSGAMGKYQIMPSNLGGSNSGWDYEALGRDVSPSQFMASPQIQDAIAQYKLKEYYNKYGPAGAAVAWYAGPGTANSYVRNPSGYNRPQGNYPSIASYVQQVLSRMR